MRVVWAYGLCFTSQMKLHPQQLDTVKDVVKNTGLRPAKGIYCQCFIHTHTHTHTHTRARGLGNEPLSFYRSHSFAFRPCSLLMNPISPSPVLRSESH